MRKISNKKLSLSQDTIRPLTALDLGAAAGGALGKASKAVTYCSCPSVQVCVTLDPPCTETIGPK